MKCKLVGGPADGQAIDVAKPMRQWCLIRDIEPRDTGETLMGLPVKVMARKALYVLDEETKPTMVFGQFGDLPVATFEETYRYTFRGYLPMGAILS